MDDPHQYQHPTTMEAWDGDGLKREPLSPEPRPPFPLRKRLALGGLAALLVVTLVATAALVIHGLRRQPVQATSVTPTVALRVTATVAPTATTAPFSPQDHGWTAYTAGVAGGRVTSGDVQFSTSSPQHGYVCGVDNSGRIIFGVTTDGGQTWAVGRSPAANDSCAIQVSLTNALDVALTSVPGGCGGASCFSSDAHYSSDGGKTWKAAPIPANTAHVGGALWSGSYRYVWAGTIEGGLGLQQSGFLTVSANGGPFTSIDPGRLVPGAQNIAIQSAIGTGDHLYLNLGYTGCSAQHCQAIVASGDGGNHWTQIPNQSSIQLMTVAANMLYGQAPDPQDPQNLAEWTSSDSGATWTRLKLPPLPSSLPVPLCWPTPDGALVGAQGAYVDYLRAGVWTILPFSTVTTAEDLHVEVALDAGGKPKALWAINDGSNSDAGIYWHAFSQTQAAS